MLLTQASFRHIIGVASNTKIIQRPKTKKTYKTTPQKTTTTRRWLFFIAARRFSPQNISTKVEGLVVRRFADNEKTRL